MNNLCERCDGSGTEWFNGVESEDDCMTCDGTGTKEGCDDLFGSFSKVDFRKIVDLPMREFSLPIDVSNNLLKLLRKWNINFAACDFALTKSDDLVFFRSKC